MQAREDRSINLVRLHAGVGDRPHEARVGHDHTPHVGPHETLDGRAVPGGLEHDLVLRPQRPGEVHDRAVDQVHPELPGDPAVLEDCDLGEGPVDVHSDDAHAPSPLLRFGSGGAGGLARHLRIRARGAAGQVVGAAT
jgi:hypothetical protein